VTGTPGKDTHRSSMARVLIVEDMPADMKLATIVLASAGHSTLQATTAEAALELAADEKPDLILMDVHLPGMDGLAATRLLKAGERTRHIPVIAVTASAMKGDRERMLAAGCDAYIDKPIDYGLLLASVAALSGRQDADDCGA
jgi:two-component system cell cycle response regulator DivK